MAPFANGKIEAYVGPHGARGGGQPRGGDRRLHRVARARPSTSRFRSSTPSRSPRRSSTPAGAASASTSFSSRTTCAARCSGTAAESPRSEGGRDRRDSAPARAVGRGRRPTWPRTGGSSRRCCAPTSRSRATSTRRSSTRSSSCATSATARPRARQPRSALGLGELHASPTPTRTSTTSFVFHNARVCRQYELEFEQLQLGRFGREIHGDVPKVFDLAGVPTKVLFAPVHTPELEIMKQMLKGAERGRLRDLHLRRLVRDRRHDARPGARRDDDHGRARPGPGGTGLGGPEDDERSAASSSLPADEGTRASGSSTTS